MFRKTTEDFGNGVISRVTCLEFLTPGRVATKTWHRLIRIFIWSWIWRLAVRQITGAMILIMEIENRGELTQPRFLYKFFENRVKQQIVDTSKLFWLPKIRYLYAKFNYFEYWESKIPPFYSESKTTGTSKCIFFSKKSPFILPLYYNILNFRPWKTSGMRRMNGCEHGMAKKLPWKSEKFEFGNEAMALNSYKTIFRTELWKCWNTTLQKFTLCSQEEIINKCLQSFLNK